MPFQQLLFRLTATLLCILTFSAAQALAADAKDGSFTTSDGVRLHYIEAGSGDVLIMIPGWSQTAAQFKHQIAGLSDRYRVIAIDMRGHGDSDKPNHGYRIHRLSADVHEFLIANNLKNVTLSGHSLGCSVIRGYWELFGRDSVNRLILIDQMPMITGNPSWSEQEKIDAGAILDKDSLYSVTNSLAGPDGVKTTEGFIGGMFNKSYSRRGELGGRAEPEDAAALCCTTALRSRHQRLARCDSVDRHPDIGGRRQGEPGGMEIAGLGRQADSRFTHGDLRDRRRRQSLHVHGEPGEVQPHREGVHGVAGATRGPLGIAPSVQPLEVTWRARKADESKCLRSGMSRDCIGKPMRKHASRRLDDER